MGGIENQILKIAIVYNECNCPTSSFMANSPPSNMSTEIGGADQTQTLDYQYNMMEYTYGQDCGEHDVVLTPSKPFLSLTTSGVNLSPQGRPYPDSLTLSGTTIEDVGVHNFQITIS